MDKIQTRVNEILRMVLHLDRSIESVEDIISTDDLRRQRQEAREAAMGKSQTAIDQVSRLADDIIADVMVIQAHTRQRDLEIQ